MRKTSTASEVAPDRPLFGGPASRNPRGVVGRGRKTATAILREVESNPVERAPRGACFDREGEKDRFATLMQYQGAVPEVKKREEVRTRTKHYCPPGSNKGMHEGDVDWQKRFGELAKDVEENQAFLERMEAAGQVRTPLCGLVTAIVVKM